MKFWKVFLLVLQVTICLTVFVLEGNLFLNFFKKQLSKKPPPLATLTTPNQSVLGQTTTNLSALQGLTYKVPVTFGDKVILQGNVVITGETLDLHGGKIINASNLIQSNTTQTTSNNGVLTFQGQTGDITLTAGTGISIAGTTISNTIPPFSLPQDLDTNASPTFLGLTAHGTILPSAATVNLGSPSNYFGTLYAQNIVSPVLSGQTNLWQVNNGALFPTTLTNDVFLGGNSTASAKIGFINLAGSTPTATIASNLSLKVPTGINPIATLNLLNGGALSIQTSLTGDVGLNSKLYVANNGQVGIGTTTPASLLQLKNGGIRIDSGQKLRFEDSGSANWELGRENNPVGAQTLTSAALVETIFNDPLQGLMIRNNSGTSLLEIRGSDGMAYFKGNVGIGINKPTVSLAINGSAASNAADIIYQNGGKRYLQVNNPSAGSTPVSTTSANAILYVGKDTGGRSINAVGSINQNNADFAEYFLQATPGNLSPGDVVCSAEKHNAVQKCEQGQSGQQQLIGVVSTDPGFVGNDTVFDKNHPENSAVVALLGQVPVNVATSNGAIHAGDYLTASPIAGVAVKATQAGEVIGKALQDYSDTNPQQSGKIMMLVNLTYANPQAQMANTTLLQLQNPPLTASIAAQLGKVDDLIKTVTDLQQISSTAAFLNPNPYLLTTNRNATVSGTLNVLGRTVVSNLGVTGVITSGLLTIDGMDTTQETPGTSINSLQTLYLQPLRAAGIDFLHGAITMSQTGNLQVHATITAKKYDVDIAETQAASAGKVTIPAGQTTAIITTTALTPNSLIFATPDTFPVAIAKQKLSPQQFVVKIAKPLPKNLEIDWWILN